MELSLKKIDYSELNARQKENFNFAEISAVLGRLRIYHDALALR
jgi:hypothetical protein